MAKSKTKFVIGFFLFAAAAFGAWWKFWKNNLNRFKWVNDSKETFSPKDRGYTLQLDGTTVTVKEKPSLTGTLVDDGRTIAWNNGAKWKRAA